MPIHTSIWKVGAKPEALAESSLAREQTLEEMIVAEPRLLSEEWMLIGRQVITDFGGRVDLIAMSPDGSLVIIELKRDRTPREVVAQALDYADWVSKLRADEVALIYEHFAPGSNLANDFQTRFSAELDGDMVNQSHEIVIVASSLDDSSERIVKYLSDRNIAINILCFQVFTLNGEQLLSRSWLLDPVRSQITSTSAIASESESWNSEFYCSFGVSESRSWDDAVQYGFVCGGGGVWYSRTLAFLKPGDRVWVNIPTSGYVGVGRVTAASRPANNFTVKDSAGVDVLFVDIATRGSYHRQFIDDLDKCEYFVSVEWLQTVSMADAVKEIGLFGNQNTVCKPTAPKWRFTVEKLKQRFPRFATGDESSSPR